MTSSWILGIIFHWFNMILIPVVLFGGAVMATRAGMKPHAWRGWFYVALGLAMVGVGYFGAGWLRADGIAVCEAHYQQLIADQKKAEQDAIDRADKLEAVLSATRAELSRIRTELENVYVAEVEEEAIAEEAARQEEAAATGICPACNCTDSQRDIDRLQSLWR